MSMEELISDKPPEPTRKPPVVLARDDDKVRVVVQHISLGRGYGPGPSTEIMLSMTVDDALMVQHPKTVKAEIVKAVARKLEEEDFLSTVHSPNAIKSVHMTRSTASTAENWKAGPLSSAERAKRVADYFVAAPAGLFSDAST